ncbi:radical SAM/SPASM domain-containing protein [Anaerocolumna aminovalerica]|uniref:radical SAM/SPASM domain-containing protein n=1 Tax=Anaerocolumna aminovalerica TaxID=1527 RepID=UPI000BE37ABC|nr:SPASM domain-containing protein [Anaerocolumna aminovalerica]
MNQFSMLIKPASSLCNMRCKYCFYSDVSEHREVKSNGIMNQETTDYLIDRTFEYVKKPCIITFAFQGGEPTVAGYDYFEYFTRRVEEVNKGQNKIQYSIQTNGQLMDEKFCKLFRKYNFLVGLSQDGPKEFHDVNRLGADKKGTFEHTNRAIKLMDQFHVEYNILSVITKQMAKKPQTLFRYYERRKFQYVQLIPCLKSLDFSPNDPLNKYDLTPHEYASFLIDFFQQWYVAFKNNQYISIRQFDNLVYMLKGRPAEQCGILGHCSVQCVIEADGSVYPCDFYVLDDFKLGNLKENSFETMIQSSAAQKFLKFETPKNPLCKTCQVYPMCGGGCKRYRSFYAEEDNYCPYQDFLYQVYPKLEEIARFVN